MKTLKDFSYFYSYDCEKFMKVASKDFIFSKDDISKLMD